MSKGAIAIVLLVLAMLPLTGCFREAAEAIDAGVGCLRTQGCWR